MKKLESYDNVEHALLEEKVGRIVREIMKNETKTGGEVNVGPIGLFAFGITTLLMNFSNLGLFKQDAAILAMGLFSGGLAQIIVGILEGAIKKNTFGAVAFVSYGSFW